MMMNLLLGVGVLLLRGMMLSAIGLQTDADSILMWGASSLCGNRTKRPSGARTPL